MSPQPAVLATTDRVDSRRPEKNAAILESAGNLFLEHGFGAVSMDQVAKLAGVSKATVYAHFESKERLFAAVVHQGCQSYSEGVVPDPAKVPDIRQALDHLAHGIARFLLSQKALGIYRVIVAEGPRVPALVDEFYRAGPLPFLRLLTGFFRDADTAGKLSVPDPRLAAHQLIWLVRGPLFMRRFFELPAAEDDPDEETVIREAVETIMRRYAVAA